MHTPKELETVWNLFNLLQKLSDLLFDRYHDYLLERHCDQETLHYLEEQIQLLTLKQYTQSENPHNSPK